MPNKKFQVPINLVNLASDPVSSSEGDMYYNTTSDLVKVYANGSWINVGYSSETDPIFTASPAYNITSQKITNWDTSYGWGNHTSAGYLTSSLAASTYLTQSNATSTYLTQSNASSTYLTQSSAASTYLTQSSASSTYLTQANATSTYLTSATASTTYAPLFSPTFTGTVTIPTGAIISGYLTTASASSTYQSKDSDLTDIAALTGNGIIRKTAGVWGMDSNTYLTSYTETDPVFLASPSYGITSTNITNWNTAYTDRNKWDGGVTGLVAATGRTSLGLGTMAVETATNYALLSGATFTGAISGTSLTLSGDLTVNGTTTTINSTTLSVDDKNIELGSIVSPTNATADGGGITLKGTTDKTFNWVDSTSSWTSSENIDLASGKTLKINGTNVLSATNYIGKAATSGNADTVTSGVYLNTANAFTVGGHTITNASDIIGLSVTGVAGQTTNNIFQVGTSGSTVFLVGPTGTTTVNGFLQAFSNQLQSGKMTIGQSSLNNSSQLFVTSAAVGNIGLAIRGAASQTGDLQQWQSYDGTTATSVAVVTPTGIIRSAANITAGTIAAGVSPALLNSIGFGATQIGIVARGAASQTGDLQQWQNSSNTVLGGITGIGQQYIYSTTPLWGAYGNVNITVSTPTYSAVNGTMTIITSAAHNTLVGQSVYISGATPSTYNGSFVAQAGTTGTTLVIKSASDLGPITVVGSLKTSPQLSISVTDDYNTGLVVRRRTANHAANLQEWQDENGNVISSFAGTGRFLIRSGNTDYNAGLSLGSANPAIQAMTVQGTTSQNTDLIRIRNEGSVVTAGFNSVGQFYTGSTTPIYGSHLPTLTATSVDVVTANTVRINFNAVPAVTQYGMITVAGITGNVTGAGVDGTYPIQSVTSSSIVYVYPTGGLTVGTGKTVTTLANIIVTVPAQMSITSRDATTKGLIVKGATSQTASIQEWQVATGLVSGVNPNGSLFVSTYGNIGPYGLGVGSVNGANGIAMVIRGSAGQIGDLLQLQNSSTTVFAGFGAAGELYSGITGSTGAAASPSNIGFVTPIAIASTSQTSSSTVTYNTTYNHGLVVGQYVNITGVTSTPTTLVHNISGLVNSVTSSTQFTMIAAASGSNTSSGTGTVTSTRTQAFIQATSTYSAALRLRAASSKSVTVTAASGNGTTVTYTATQSGYNALIVGDTVTITNLTITTGSSLNLSSQIVVTSSATQFTVTNATVGTAVATQAGTATVVAYAAPFLLENAAGATLMRVDPDGGVRATSFANLNSYTNANLTPSTTGWILGAYASASTSIPLKIQNANAGTITGDLTQWLNNVGTVLTYINSAGVLNAPGISISGNALFNYQTTFQNSTITPLIAKNLGGTADIEQWQNSVGTVLGGLNTVGQTFTGSTSSILSAVGGTIQSIAAGANPLVTMASAHNLAVGDLVTLASTTSGVYDGKFVIATVPLTTTFTITSALTTGQGTAAGTVSAPAQASITARSAGTTGLVVRGATSQAAYLQEWQNSAGTIVARVTSSGFLLTAGGLSVGSSTNTLINGTGTGVVGGGLGVLAIGNVTTVPTSNPTGGGVLYEEAGALKHRGSGGLVTTIAGATAIGEASYKPAAAASMLISKLTSGDWISFTNSSATPATARTEAREHCQIVQFPYDVTLDRLSVYVGTAGSAGAVVRLGIRNDNNGRPGTVLLDAGTAATTSSTAYATITLSPTVTLTANTPYWLSATNQGTPATRAITRFPSQWNCGQVGSTTQDIASAFGYYQNSVTDTLPFSFTVAGLVQLNAGDGFVWVVRSS